MSAVQRATKEIQRWHGGALVLMWVIALPPAVLAWVQGQEVRQAAAVVSFLRDASDVARASRDSAGNALPRRLTSVADPVAIQHAVLETRIHRLLLTTGLMLVMYGAFLAATLLWLGGRARERWQGS
jgi:hypothetical protein